VNIAIIEDEEMAAERLQDLIHEIDASIGIMARLSSVKESVQWFKTHHPDLVFMDIKLSDGNSFEIFNKVQIDAPVIFTTAYDQYAIKAFKHNSVDYLLKPVRKDDLRQSLEKFKSLHTLEQIDLQAILNAMRARQPEYKQRFLIQIGDRLEKVEIRNIAYFYAMEKAVFCATQQKKTYTMDQSLDKLQELLDPEQFFRINRKMIIRYEAINGMVAYSRSRIKIELVPPPPRGIDPVVSVERSARFKEWIDK
jgi:DNA-binding LytR/AlgR family response regulator